MKKTILLLCFALIPLAGFCPQMTRLPITLPEPIRIFDPMLWAFQRVESNFDTDTINKLGYGGILQIGQEMVDETNRLCRKQGIPLRFKLNDRLDSLKSVQMWYIVQDYHNPDYNLRRACKVWNPLASERYYKKIKKQIIVANQKKYLKIFGFLIN